MVRRPPKYGYLEVDPPLSSVSEDTNIKDLDDSNFDQVSISSTFYAKILAPKNYKAKHN